MKQSSLIEAKSTPCLCWLPFSWLKTLTVGNYSAGEQQSLKLMCNHRLEPDIKLNLAIFGSHKHPCINKCCAHCISAASLHNSVVHLLFCYRQKSCFSYSKRFKPLSLHTTNAKSQQANEQTVFKSKQLL